MSPQTEREELKKDARIFGQTIIIILLSILLAAVVIVGIFARGGNDKANDAAVSSGNVERILSGYQTLIDRDQCLRQYSSALTSTRQALDDLLAEQQQTLVEGFAAVTDGDDPLVAVLVAKNEKLNPEIDRAQLVYAKANKDYNQAIDRAGSEPAKFLKDCKKEGN